MRNTASRLLFILFGIASALSLQASSTVVLESFEEADLDMPPGVTTNGFTADFCNFRAPDGSSRGFCNTNFSLFTFYGGRSGAGNVSNFQYTATGANDPFVTEGKHSMAVTFYAEGFGNDFQFVLSDTNSALVEQAAAAGQVGRYVLRYDLIFSNPGQYVFFNQTAFIGASWDYLQLSGANTNGLAVYSCALELPALGLPLTNSGTNVQIVFANNFATKNPSAFTNCTIYLDNFRLVDTYASPSTKPVVYELHSFETNLDGATNLFPTVTSFYGNPVTGRATLSRYLTNGLYDPTVNGVSNVFTMNNSDAGGFPAATDSDFAVTDGRYALQVVNNSPTAYQADFAISFAGTKLAQVLSSNFPPAQLAHYTLRWDTSMPATPAYFDRAYANFTYSTGAAALPMAQGRRESQSEGGLQRATYSVTLDQIAAWGGSPIGGNPAIIFFFDGSNVGTPLVYYFDNFQLLDTAPVTHPPVITASSYNAATRHFTLTWSSAAGATYNVLFSPTLAPANFTAIATGVVSAGATTSTTVTLPAGNAGFLRVAQQ